MTASSAIGDLTARRLGLGTMSLTGRGTCGARTARMRAGRIKAGLRKVRP